MNEQIATLPRSLEDISIESEARRICDSRNSTDAETFRHMQAYLRHKAFLRSVEPFMKLKTRILGFRMLDRIVMKSDGSVDRVEYKPLPVEAQKTLEQIEELIRAEATRYGFVFDCPVETQP